MRETVHPWLQVPTQGDGDVEASTSNPSHKALHSSRSNTIRPNQYVLVLKKEIDAYKVCCGGKDKGGYIKLNEEWSESRVGEVEGHASWHMVMNARKQGARESLIGLLDEVLSDVLPSWVTSPLNLGGGSLCEYLCKHEVICLLKGECHGNSLCFPFKIPSSKANKHPFYLTKSKVCPSYLKMSLGVLQAKPTPKWRFEGVHVLLCYAMHGAPKVMHNGERQEVCHKCSHAWCLNPHHLKWGTHKDNMAAHWEAKRKREKGMKEKKEERMRGARQQGARKA